MARKKKSKSKQAKNKNNDFLLLLSLATILIVILIAWIFGLFNKKPVVKDKQASRISVLSAPKMWEYEKDKKFSLQFDKDGKVTIKTDCNGGSATIEFNDDQISITNVAQTLMYCPKSKEKDFYDKLSKVNSFEVDFENSELIFTNGKDEMIFKKVN